VEADPLGFHQRLDQVTRHRQVGAFGGDDGKTLVDDLPVRAVVEVQQGDVHGHDRKP